MVRGQRNRTEEAVSSEKLYCIFLFFQCFYCFDPWNRLEQVSEKLRQRVMEQHNSIKSINEQVEDQRRQLEAQERRIRQQKPSGEQLWFHLPAKVVVNVLHFLPRAAWVSLAATNSCMYARLDAIIVKHFPRVRQTVVSH